MTRCFSGSSPPRCCRTNASLTIATRADAGGILLRERAAPLHRNTERLEVVRHHHVEARARALRRTADRTALDDERPAVADADHGIQFEDGR